MTSESIQDPAIHYAKDLKALYRRHVQGAYVRSFASLIYWWFAVIFYKTGELGFHHLIGITASVAYLIMINPPTLLVLKHAKSKSNYKYTSLVINILEIIGYTAIIYFAGGVEAANLTLMYAALITYAGIVAPRPLPFILATICSVSFSLMVALVYLGILPNQSKLPDNHFPLMNQIETITVTIVLLFVVAFIVSYTAGLLARNRDKLRQQNLDLMEKAATLEEVGKNLRNAHQSLEIRVKERTAELAKANKDLYTELTERKRAEEASRQSEEKYRAIIENMEEGYIEVDLTGRLTFFNEAALKFLGYSKEETMGMHYKKYTDKENSRKIFKLYNEVYRTHIPRAWVEWEAIRKDGSRRTVEGSASLMWDTERRPTGFRSLFRDITDRKHLQKEHEQLQERLHRAEKMEVLGMLAGGVTHDLNNVLGVLVGYSELLLQNLPQDNPPRRRAMQLLKGGERAATIIQDLLTLTRRGVLVSDVVNLNRVISDFLQTPEFEALKTRHPGVTFKTSLDVELLNVEGSLSHLGKTVMNLISNAAEAITGMGRVLIRTENRYVDKPIHGYDSTQEGEYAVLTVSDTGSGISSADIGKIFEPFYTKKVMGRSGTGLGLAAVWRTVKDHSGHIDVQSAEGKGTTFTLYFPVTREAVTKHEEAVPQSTYMGRGEHILVVDDVEGQRLLASAMLESLGYKVDSVASGEEAIEFVKSQSVNLLILDIIMDPGIDGLETYRRIRQVRKDQKAIIVSGFAITERLRKTQGLGAGSYVKKPYLPEKIGLAVRKELDRI